MEERRGRLDTTERIVIGFETVLLISTILVRLDKQDRTKYDVLYEK